MLGRLARERREQVPEHHPALQCRGSRTGHVRSRWPRNALACHRQDPRRTWDSSRETAPGSGCSGRKSPNPHARCLPCWCTSHRTLQYRNAHTSEVLAAVPNMHCRLPAGRLQRWRIAPSARSVGSRCSEKAFSSTSCRQATSGRYASSSPRTRGRRYCGSRYLQHNTQGGVVQLKAAAVPSGAGEERGGPPQAKARPSRPSAAISRGGHHSGHSRHRPGPGRRLLTATDSWQRSLRLPRWMRIGRPAHCM
jgi:hypothetical protein